MMMTVCAGRFTPQASVAVQHSTLMTPHSNICSVIVRSDRSIPAWWIPMPCRWKGVVLVVKEVYCVWCVVRQLDWPKRRGDGRSQHCRRGRGYGIKGRVRVVLTLKNSCCTSMLRDFSTARFHAPNKSCPQFSSKLLVPILAVRSLIASAVRDVSFLECTNIMTCFPLSRAVTIFSQAF